MAMAALRRKKLPYDLDPAIFRVLEAKFSAETAQGVGKSTSLLSMSMDGKDGTIGYGSIEEIKKIWTAVVERPEPSEAIEIISKTTRHHRR